jgi:hypothetical protein
MTPARILALTENSTIQGQRRLPADGLHGPVGVGL